MPQSTPLSLSHLGCNRGNNSHDAWLTLIVRGGRGDATGKLALPLCIIFAVFEVEKEIPDKEVCCPQSAQR